MEIVRRIAERMKTMGLRASDIARRTGIHPSRISRWLDGQGEPNLVQFRILVQAVEASADDILGIVPPAKLNDDERIILTMANDLGYPEARRRLLGIATPLIEAVETPKPAPPPVVAPREHDRRSATG